MANILIIDDDPISLKLLSAYLKGSPHDVTSARNGREALDIILSKEPQYFSCVISDYMMPEMDGLELTHALKQDYQRQMIPVILQTSNTSETEIQKGLEAGVFYYLIKPFTKETLLSTLEAAIKDFKNHTETLLKLEQVSASLGLLKNANFQYKSIDDAKHLSNFIAYLTDDPVQIGVGLFELMINAVEHGNLGITYDEKTELVANGTLQNEIESRLRQDLYRHKFVRVDVRTTPDELRVTISDMGKGFNFEDYMEFSVERAMDNHGRGIMMANKLSFDGLYYSDGGTSVTCVKRLAGEMVLFN